MDFAAGASYITKGCRTFYHDRKAWKYALIPVGIVLILYALIAAGIFTLCSAGSNQVSSAFDGCPEWLSWLGSGITTLTFLFGAVLLLIVVATTISAFYELFGGFCFDYLVEHIVRTRYHQCPVQNPFSWQLSFFCQALLWGVKNLIIFIVLFIVSLFFPIIGQIVLVVVMGYALGITYMISAGCCEGCSLYDLRRLSKRKWLMVLGFGSCANLLLLIPFSALILLPGFVVGGTMLYHEQIKEVR